MDEEYEEDLTIEPFVDRTVFTMEPGMIDWELLEEMSDADPSSHEYRRLMKELKIQGRQVRRGYRNRWSDEDEW